MTTKIDLAALETAARAACNLSDGLGVPHAVRIAPDVLAAIVARLRFLESAADSIVTIADEAFGLGPVMPLEDTLSRIERGIFEQHRDLANANIAIERMAPVVRAAEGWRDNGPVGAGLVKAVDDYRSKLKGVPSEPADDAPLFAANAGLLALRKLIESSNWSDGWLAINLIDSVLESSAVKS